MKNCAVAGDGFHGRMFFMNHLCILTSGPIQRSVLLQVVVVTRRWTRTSACTIYVSSGFAFVHGDSTTVTTDVCARGGFSEA